MDGGHSVRMPLRVDEHTPTDANLDESFPNPNGVSKKAIYHFRIETRKPTPSKLSPERLLKTTRRLSISQDKLGTRLLMETDAAISE